MTSAVYSVCSAFRPAYTRKPKKRTSGPAANGPNAKAKEAAESPTANTEPYRLACRRSAMCASCGKMLVSTRPSPRPRPALGRIRCSSRCANGT